MSDISSLITHNSFFIIWKFSTYTPPLFGPSTRLCFHSKNSKLLTFCGTHGLTRCVSTKWLPVSLMETLLSHSSLHFQLKHEALYLHKNCRATTLYSQKKKAYNEKNNNLHKAYFCLPQTKSQIVLPFPQPRFAPFTTLNLSIFFLFLFFLFFNAYP